MQFCFLSEPHVSLLRGTLSLAMFETFRQNSRTLSEPEEACLRQSRDKGGMARAELAQTRGRAMARARTGSPCLAEYAGGAQP